jgi:hypothetical protein
MHTVTRKLSVSLCVFVRRFNCRTCYWKPWPCNRCTIHAEGVTQEQCAGMIDHPLLNWQAPTATTLHAAMSNGPETNSGECLAGTNKLNISKVMPGLHKSPCTSCHRKPCASRPSQHLQCVTAVTAPLSTVTAVSSSKPWSTCAPAAMV